MKRLLVLTSFLSVLCYMSVAQVTSSPSPIPSGYTDEFVLTYDATRGNGGMIGAAECYSHMGLITEKSADMHDWRYIVKIDKWGTKEQPKWDNVGTDLWQLRINNMYAFFNCPESETIKAIIMVFHDGNGNDSKMGMSTNGGDILVGVGEEVLVDIWDNYNPAAVVNKARPEGIVNGIYYGADETSVTLCTYAASKTEPAKHVFLVGDFNDWKIDNSFQLYQDGNYFWITLTGLEKGKEYRFQYAVERADGVKKQISDLFSEKVIHSDDQYEPRSIDPTLIDYPDYGADGYVTVIQTGKTQYNWSDGTLNFKRPDKNNLIIYELWVYDHTPKRNIEGLMERLDYLQNLGVNAIELMPLNEFDGNYNWGYSPNHYFALDKAYGTPEQFKTFVDECHKRGIAVILDMVFNHATGQNPMNKLYPYTSYNSTQTDLRLNPWFNVSAPHPDNVYEDWNHGFEPARDHFTRVLQYWLTEYKVDGYRMDMSHGLCSEDDEYSAVENLKYYYTNGVKSVSDDAYFILEHWGVHMGTDRPKLVNEGMMCWENTNMAFQQAAMGWLKDGDDMSNANKDNYVSYSDNHDEERCFFKAKQWGNGDLKTNENARIARIPLLLGFESMLNGPKLFYHFAEIGFDYSIYQKQDGSWGQDGYNAYGQLVVPQYVQEEAKMQIKARPENLGWFEEGPRMNGYQRLAKIIQLRTRLIPNVFEGNPTATSFASGSTIRFVQWGNDVFVVGNFSATEEQFIILPSGTWYDYLDGNEKAASSYYLEPGEIKVFTGKQVSAPDVPNHYNFEKDEEFIQYSIQTSVNNADWGYVSAPATGGENTNVTISAVPNEHYYFSGWSDGDTSNPRTFVLTQDTSFTAIFAVNQYSINVASSDNTKGSVTGAGSYDYGSVAVLIATPQTGYQFNGWNDGSTDNPHYVAVLGDASYTAYFDTKMCQLDVKPNDIMGGAVSGSGTYAYGTQVTVTASENSGYLFLKWSNGETYNPYKFTIVNDMQLIAFFQQTQAEIIEVDEITVTPEDNSANIQWPQVDDAYTYTLIIWADAEHSEKVCTLTFDASGHLTNIDFSKKANKSIYAQEAQVAGFSFTVTGLDEDTQYFYELEAADEGGTTISTEAGEFRTTKNNPMSIEHTNTQTVTACKVLSNGVLYIEREGKTYNAQGARVE